MSTFKASMVTDAKRVVRGLQWDFAKKTFLADSVENRRVSRVLLVPGRAAHEEISVAREVCRGAHVTAVDLDPEATAAAQAAGADLVLCRDLTDRDALKDQGRFDIISVDMCMSAGPDMARVVSNSWGALCSGGALIAAFSYGRDAALAYEQLTHDARRGTSPAHRATHPVKNQVLHLSGASDALLGRILYLQGLRSSDRLVSVLGYKGASMPMCSVMWQKRRAARQGDIDYLWVENADLRPACLADWGDDAPSQLFATPARRIAAWRAVKTRSAP